MITVKVRVIPLNLDAVPLHSQPAIFVGMTPPSTNMTA